MDGLDRLKKEVKVLRQIVRNRQAEINQIRAQLRKVEQVNLEIKEGLY